MSESTIEYSTPFQAHSPRDVDLDVQSLASLTRMSSLPRVGFQLTRNDRVLRTIFDNLFKLESLDITGDSRTYSPRLLLEKLRPEIRLQHLSIEFPDRKFVQALPELARRLGDNLKSLLIRCDSSTLVKDEGLLKISPHLMNLERLSIVGCRSLTGVGIEALLSHSQRGMKELAMEGLAVVSLS